MVVVYVVQKESAHESVGGNRPQDFHRRKVMHASVRHLEQNIVRHRDRRGGWRLQWIIDQLMYGRENIKKQQILSKRMIKSILLLKCF